MYVLAQGKGLGEWSPKGPIGRSSDMFHWCLLFPLHLCCMGCMQHRPHDLQVGNDGFFWVWSQFSVWESGQHGFPLQPVTLSKWILCISGSVHDVRFSLLHLAGSFVKLNCKIMMSIIRSSQFGELLFTYTRYVVPRLCWCHSTRPPKEGTVSWLLSMDPALNWSHQHKGFNAVISQVIIGNLRCLPTTHYWLTCMCVRDCVCV